MRAREKHYSHERKERPLPTGLTVLPQPAPLQDGLRTYLTERGLSADIAQANGWYVSINAGDAHERIVMPATNTRGYVYWQARAVDPSVPARYMSPDYAASDSAILVWPKTPGRTAVLVEGPMDALAAAEHGHVGIALMGKQLRPGVFDHIAGIFQRCHVFIVPDSDGIEDACRWMGELAKRGITTEIVFTGHKDLAATPKHIREKLLG